MPGDVLILIPAAGASSRMRGGDKLLEIVEGEPLLRRQVRIALATGCRVAVTLPPDRPARAAVLDGLAVERLEVPDAASGMAASLRAGAARAADGPWTGLMILPADMPEMTTDALIAVLSAFAAEPDRIWRGQSAEGRAGHPAVFPRDLWSSLAQLTGDTGGSPVIRANPDRVSAVILPGRMALTDLDTPEEWAAWRAGLREGG